MTPGEIVAVALAIYAAALVAAVSGFGFALMSVPLMSQAVATRDAVVISTLIGAAVSLVQTYQGHRHADRVMVRRLVLSAYLGMPIGILAFTRLDDTALRIVLGVAVLVAVALLAIGPDLASVGRPLEFGAGFVSGMLNTSLSTNGPPLAFALQARRLDPNAFRGTINVVFVCSYAVGIPLFVLVGGITGKGLLGALVGLPSMMVGFASGVPLRRHVEGDRFRWLVLVLLAATAVSAIASALR